ncbi:unnamed protein product [Pneumocystis jirovecii]|uniref:RNA helicase n=1 Tax=Pneumocystis jirovecii TaxID=42068 RepID=L0PAW8_PNEJI|nr:unnamed protein product [Pneumocystis jirovecii]CCJ31057.1 unnamed protein product [Pneumocystis jirovecii]
MQESIKTEKEPKDYQEKTNKRSAEEELKKNLKKRRTSRATKRRRSRRKKPLVEEEDKEGSMSRIFVAAKNGLNCLNHSTKWAHIRNTSQTAVGRKVIKSYSSPKDINVSLKKEKRSAKEHDFDHKLLKKTDYRKKNHLESNFVLYNNEYIRKSMSFPSKEELNKFGISCDIFSDPEMFLNKVMNVKAKLVITPSNLQANFNYFYFALCKARIGEKIYVGKGHGETNTEACQNAYLYLISEIYKKDLLFDIIEEYQIGNYDSHLISQESSSKLDVLNYACRWLALPKFDTSTSYTKIKKKKLYTVKIYTDEPNLIGIGKSYEYKVAEILACINFKKMAEEHHSKNSKGLLLVKDWRNLNTSNAKQFIDFFGFKKKTGKIECVFKIKNSFWIASMKSGEKIIAISPQIKKDAENACFLVYALDICKKMPYLFTEFIEELKKGNGEFLRPLAPISANISEKSLRIMDETISQIKKIQKSEVSKDIYFQKKDNFNYLPFKPSPEFLSQRSEILLKNLENFKKNESLKDLFKKRQELPIYQYKDELLTLIKENPVCIVIGATGSGKTTQLPQFIFEDAILNNSGARCNILCTQPRRIAAISVAQRVCFERNEKLRESVGYQVRFDSKPAKPIGSINYCTTGILLKQLQDSSSSILEGISHIIVDEVHERNIQIDFLLVILKRIIKERKSLGLPPIKIVLMSATINPTLFCKYFGDEFPNGQAPSITIPGRSFPVSSYFLEEIYENLKNTFSRKEAPILFDKDTNLYIENEKAFSSDSYKEKEKTIKDEHNSDYNSSIDWSSKNYSSQNHGLLSINEKEINISDGLIATTISYIIKTSNDGSILVFLPGYSEISSLNKVLISGKAGVDFTDKSKYRIYMLHSAIPYMQNDVFEKLEPGIRKIILATNIAETSITIPDVVYVVDTCKHREKIYDQTKRITSLLSTWISQSNSKQRAGRAGRVRNGYYYALISKNRHSALAAASLPEILRSDLQEICLQIKAIGVKDSISKILSETIEVPSKEAVEYGLKRLHSLNALDENENLTPLGNVLATLPVEPSLGKMCLMGAIFKCLDPILILAASTTVRNVFLQPIELQKESREARIRLSMDYKSDHITIINCFRKWRLIRNTEGNASASIFIERNFLHRNTLQTIENIAEQILQILIDYKIVPNIKNEKLSHELGDEESNKYSDCIPLIKSLICAGFYPNIAAITNKRLLRTSNDSLVMLHPTTINFPRSSNRNLYGPPISEDIFPPGTLYVFSSKSKTDFSNTLTLKDTTLLNPLSALLFGGKLSCNHNIIKVDDWLPFYIGSTQSSIIQEFNECINKVLVQIFNKLCTQSYHNQTAYSILNENPIRDILVKGLADALYYDV